MFFRFFIFLTLVLFPFFLKGQGCSDAGFCTMGAMRPNQQVARHARVRLRAFELTQYTGYTKFQDVILSYVADFNLHIGSRYSAQVKLPYTFVSGPLGNTNGLGDISLCLTRGILSTEKFQLGATIGAKLPTNDASKSIDGRPLPMYYQTSLGTYDIIYGMSLISRKWLVATGIQHPFNENRNRFLWKPWDDTPLAAAANMYPKSHSLKRGTDIMFRVERNFRFARFNTYIGLLTIQRMTPDRIFDPSKGGKVHIMQTKGPAITAVAGAGYHFSVRSSLKFLVGFRIIEREKNPDGLSREFVSNITYEIRF